ncbi:AMP-dependent synthetase/ligase [Metarhizium album ARSEF 1941]|uniref:AMP-dependent synthetase/ligase n=1 Tax=Metarhizium album (strain ARSEF 1941) TaxID=1081103 RepID=A0A0B2WYE2_METAS|nr:AMP-dependent synthetase/ligase [Metarhizium album ARSEF 1941]KHO01262.1 AMP-dependent synthetase/ligase [Metarhizium album ARSEF 1941]
MPSLTTAELDRLWARNAKVPDAVCVSVHELIAQRACSQPDQPAVAAWDGDYTYGQLVHLVCSLADHLARNVCPRHGRVLPIVMSKSKWMPVAMLGALSGGWGIAALDVNTPTGRLAEILDMLDPPCILTTSEVRITVDTAVPALAVDELGLGDEPPAATEQRDQPTPARVAAVVFTSGSTGSPKGVMLGPECVSTAAVSGSQILQLGPGSRLFQFSSLAFDVSLHEIFMTLVAGGCLCVPSETERMHDPVAAMRRMRANYICTTPSVFMSVLAEAVVSTPIRAIVLTGEPLTSRIGPLFGTGARLFSWYGASECPVVALAPLVDRKWTRSQINSRHPGNCWVVEPDDPDALCGFGDVGELLVESPMLALGYLGAPQQTEASFAADPAWLGRGHGCVPGRRGRLYRTGDLVRNNPDWTLDYIGRKDAVVKVRGQRVDLSAVELCIWNHLRSGDVESPAPRIREVVVEPVDSATNNDGVSISCFLHVDDDAACLPRTPLATSTSLPCIRVYAPDASLDGLWPGLRRALSSVLAEYMVPSLYLQLSDVPLTQSGKVDRRLLRSLASQIPSRDLLECRAFPGQGHSLPRNDAESALQRLWAEVLGVEAAEVYTNKSFLQCGGDSLSAILLSKALSREFGLATKVPRLLRRETTIQHLATLLGQPGNGHAGDEARTDVATVLRAWEARLGLVSVRPRAAPSPSGTSRGSRVLLTGATGYLGTHILGELLQRQWVNKVVVLVRAADVGLAEERIRRAASTAGWWQPSALARIEVWPGDLTEAGLGLRPERWADMSSLDVIIHNGAVVNYSAGYDVLERANVISTFYLLEAALGSERLRAFILVSGGIRRAQGQSDAEYLRALDESEGYSQTKYVAERLTLAAGRLLRQNARSRAGQDEPSPSPASGSRTFAVIKPGYIVGDQVTGLSNTDDFIWKLVAGAVRMGSFPSDPPGYWVDMAEVSYVARRIAHRAQACASDGVSPQPVASDLEAPGPGAGSGVVLDEMNRGLPVHLFWQAVQSQAQLALRQLDWDSWIAHAHVELERELEAHPLWGIQLLLGPSLGSPARIPDADSRAVDEVGAAVRRCVQYLCSVGFIALPLNGACPSPSDAGGKYPVEDADDDHGAERRAWKGTQGERHPAIVTRSKLTYWN